MKQVASSAQLAALMALGARAQTTTIVNDPVDTSVTTIYYSVCPTATTTTITLPTQTYCPGANCNGGGAMITPAPGAGGHWGRPWSQGSEIIAYTTTGTDGKVSEYHEYLTVYNQICSTGGMEPATYTITEACPCQSTRNPMSIPSGFTTTVMACDSCGVNGAATTVTLTTPCSTGPYATQTPMTGNGSGAGSGNSNGAGSGSGSGSGVGSGSGSNSDMGSGSGSNASSGAAAGSNAGQNSIMGGNGNAGNGAGAPGAGQSGSAAPMGTGAVGSTGPYPTGMGGVWNSSNPISPPITPVSSGSGSSMGSTSPSTYTASSDKVIAAISNVVAGLILCVSWLL